MHCINSTHLKGPILGCLHPHDKNFVTPAAYLMHIVFAFHTFAEATGWVYPCCFPMFFWFLDAFIVMLTHLCWIDWLGITWTSAALYPPHSMMDYSSILVWIYSTSWVLPILLLCPLSFRMCYCLFWCQHFTTSAAVTNWLLFFDFLL